MDPIAVSFACFNSFAAASSSAFFASASFSALAFACFNSFAAASSLAFFAAASFSALAFASSGVKIVSAG